MTRERTRIIRLLEKYISISKFLSIYVMFINRFSIKKRQGAFVLDQVQPRSVYGLKARRDSNNGASIWELMQPMNQPSASGQRPPVQQQRDSADVRNQRRDPIGYFSDMKYGDEFDYGNKKSSAYQPSWESNGATHQPIAINGEN